MKQHLVRILSYGFLVWLIPFAVAIPFHTRDGKLLTDIFLFKSVMILVGSLTGSFLLASLAIRIEGKTLPTLLFTGLIWLVINWGLDFLILLPMSKMSVSDYSIQIGMGYLTMLIVAFALGRAVDRKSA
ncbi:hypothetical protein [Leptospira adleri]|uniref:Uncharacterized protein n=1 Tax=Leptospira adleri TaxID=2023186 RepID=A0A2M9YP46_9LEPT|nr:hypothetical protein [Leptospira adleri]PJZ53279.1 hypothetical protein CH380_10760 [Leptospira adleri]PJZ63913.1 hypothetical protein CH376_00350 [Leptospira adleri]